MSISSVLRVIQPALTISRNFNCWTAAITKKHRKVYERTYPTILVYSNGASAEIDYPEPRKIILLPLDLSTVSEEQRRKRLEMRKPKSKVKIVEDIQDDFDETRYLNLKKT